MFRSLTVTLAATLMLSIGSVASAERRDGEAAAPNSVVAAAWAKEAKANKGSSAAVRTLYASFGIVQGLDMVSTVVARNRGAVEVNPLLQGSYAKGMVVKAAFAGVTLLTVRAIEKKNKKAAIVTMIALNVATAAVVANNLRNAKRLN